MLTSLITDRKIRLAIVGCGRIAGKHMAALEQFKNDIDLVAACDSYLPHIEKVMQEKGIDGYQNYPEMLEKSDADVVVLCSPSGLHARQTILAAQYGKHVITEKPLATRWQDGVAMVRACDEAEVRLFEVKQNRFNPTTQLLKQAISTGRFGRLYHVNCNVYWSRPQDYYDQAKWRGTWEFDGGALLNQASHYADLLYWLLGPIKSVHAFMGTLGRAIEVEDTAALNIQYRSGAIGSMNLTMLTYPKNLEGSITLLGEKGSVKLGGLAANQIEHWQFADQRPEDETITNASEQTSQAYGFGHPLYYANIVDVFRGRAGPATDGREGLKSLEFMIAAYLSARDGRVVSLPLEH